MDRAFNHPWTRRHDDPRSNLFNSVAEIDYPTTLADLIGICQNRPVGQGLKAAGSHWALSPAAFSDHTFIETHDPADLHVAMSRTLHDVIPGCLHPNLEQRMTNKDFVQVNGTLCHVESGKRIYQLYAELDETDPLTFPEMLGGYMKEKYGVDHFAGPWGFVTLGGAGGQTVVGAFSTGTHGGDFDRGPLDESVMAIHLVADGGRHYWIERVDERFAPQLVDDDKLTAQYDTAEHGGPGNFTIIREPSNETFNAVLVGVGRFGIIYSAMLRAVPQYSLWERRRLHVWQNVRSQIKNRDAPLDLYNDTAVEAPDTPQRFLQIVVCLTPHGGFTRNLVGVTKRWQIDVAQAPAGRGQRVGDRTPPLGLFSDNPLYARAGRSFPYTAKEDKPYLSEEPSFLSTRLLHSRSIKSFTARHFSAMPQCGSPSPARHCWECRCIRPHAPSKWQA